MFSVKVEGIEKLESAQVRLEELFSVENLTLKTIALAKEAGVVLLQASVRACIEAVYDAPNFPSLWTTTPSHPTGYIEGGNEATRTNALLDSHILTEEVGGLVQFVQIDPSAEAEGDIHSRRELVTDYAIPVHEGYEQYVYGRDTGVFHAGRFWFDVAQQEAGPVIAAFVEVSFMQIITEILTEVF